MVIPVNFTKNVSETSHNIFTFYFEEAIKCAELKNIRSQFEKYALESDVPKPYIEDFLSNFRWVWWLEEDEISRSKTRLGVLW